jgi:hypothetical protein
MREDEHSRIFEITIRRKANMLPYWWVSRSKDLSRLDMP